MSSVILKSKIRSSVVLSDLLLVPLVVTVAQGLITWFLSWIPVVGFFIPGISASLWSIEMLCLYLRGLEQVLACVKVTETGLEGRSSVRFRRFRVLFSEVTRLEVKHGIVIYTEKRRHGKKKKVVYKVANVENVAEILAAYEEARMLSKPDIVIEDAPFAETAAERVAR